MSWTQSVNHIVNGEAVSAGVAGRPDRALESRTAYLKERVEESALGEGIYAHDVPLSSDVLVDHAVYWNEANGRFEGALAAAEVDSTSGTIVNSTSSEVVGIVTLKSSSTQGDILLFGKASLDLANAFSGTVTAGRYYLSGAEAGHLVKQRPPVGVAVLFADGLGNVYVNPQVKSFADDHTHYAFDLVTLPAGTHTPPEVGSRHVITDVDSDVPGWLPAHHSIFQGAAPSGAIFGYNLTQHPALRSVWPPVPLAAVSLVWDKGDGTHVGGTDIPLGRDGLVTIDVNGIWWMSDCYEDVPWPTLLNTTASSSNSISSATAECPRTETMRLRLLYARMTYANNRAVVTTLTPVANSGITLKDSNGNDAIVGDLTLDYSSPAFMTTFSTERVLKSPERKLMAPAPEIKSAEQILPFQLYDSSGAHNVVKFGLPSVSMMTLAAVVKGRFKIPRTDPGGSLSLRLVLAVDADGFLPDLIVSWRRLPACATSCNCYTTETFSTLKMGQRVNNGDRLEVESNSVNVSAGDTVFVELTRSQDDYRGELNLIDIEGTLRT